MGHVAAPAPDLFRELTGDLSPKDFPSLTPLQKSKITDFVKLGGKVKDVMGEIGRLLKATTGAVVTIQSKECVLVTENNQQITYYTRTDRKLKKYVKEYFRLQQKLFKWASVFSSLAKKPENSQPTNPDFSPDVNCFMPDLIVFFRRCTEIGYEGWDIKPDDSAGKFRLELNAQLAIFSALCFEIWNNFKAIKSASASKKEADKATRGYANADIAANAFCMAGSLIFTVIKLNVASPGYFLNQTVTSQHPILDYPVFRGDLIGMSSLDFDVRLINALWGVMSLAFLAGSIIWGIRDFKLKKKADKMLLHLREIESLEGEDSKEKAKKKLTYLLHCLKPAPFELEALRQKYPNDTKEEYEKRVKKLSRKKAARFQRVVGSNAALMVERDAMGHLENLTTDNVEDVKITNATDFLKKVENEIGIQKKNFIWSIFINIMWAISNLFWLVLTGISWAIGEIKASGGTVSTALNTACNVFMVLAAVFCFIVVAISIARFVYRKISAKHSTIELESQKPSWALRGFLWLLVTASAIFFMLSAWPALGIIAMWAGMVLLLACLTIIDIVECKTIPKMEEEEKLHKIVPKLIAERYCATLIEEIKMGKDISLTSDAKNHLARIVGYDFVMIEAALRNYSNNTEDEAKVIDKLKEHFPLDDLISAAEKKRLQHEKSFTRKIRESRLASRISEFWNRRRGGYQLAPSEDLIPSAPSTASLEDSSGS